MADADAKTLTPAELAREWRVDVHRVLTWIRAGQLPAANLASNPLGRPRYRIARADADDFWRSRMVKPMPRPPRQHKTPADKLAWLGVNL